MNIKTELVIGLLHFTALQTSLLSAPNSCEQDDLRMRMATFTTADLRDADSSNKLLTTINTPSEMSCLHRCVRDSNCSFTRWDTNSFKCELWLEVDENIIKSKSKVRVKFEENVKTQVITCNHIYIGI